jgi:ethanolamine utilization microcompartment shell protein EutL
MRSTQHLYGGVAVSDDCNQEPNYVCNRGKERSSLPDNMAKRKREEAGDVLERTKATQKKEKHKNGTSKKEIVPKSTSTVSENVVQSIPKALRIVVGSYEKVLCGIDARFKSAETVSIHTTYLT